MLFIGKDVSKAISIWKASGWRAEHALQTLKDKCLVQVQIRFDLPDRMDRIHSEMTWHRIHSEMTCHHEPTFILRMHDLLRDLGRAMAYNDTSHPRRLWRPEDLIGMHNIRGLQNILMGPILPASEGFRCSSHIEESGLHMAYFLGNSKTSTHLQWLELYFNSSHRYIPEWIPLQNLHTLRLEGVLHRRLWQSEYQVPLKLKELYYCFKGLNFPGCTQDMFMTELNELVSSFGMLERLERLHLEFDSEFSKWNIEWKCLLKSLRKLANLQTLELTSFKVEGEFALSNRGETTDDRFRMKSLEAITLRGALKTTKVSISAQFCPNLKSLKLYSMKDLTAVDLTGVTTLECLELWECGSLRKVLGSDLLQLEIFHIKLCRTMRELPNFGGVSFLKRIYISRCKKLQDISAIERLKGLKRICIAYCPKLKSIKAIEQLKGLKRIWIQDCAQLESVICFKELKELKRIFIGHCANLQDIEGIEFLIRLESIIIVQCRKLQNIRGIEELKGLKEMIIADSPIISCVKRLQRLPSELTILVGRSAISDEDGFTRRSPMSMANGFCGRECSFLRRYCRKQVEEMIHSSHKTQHSFSTFISCAVLDGHPCIGSDICNGTRIMHEGYRLRPIYLSFHGKGMIYTCVVNEERFSKYDSWMPSCRIEAAFLRGVKAGEESKTLPILQSLFAQLYVDNSVYFKDPHDFDPDDSDEDYFEGVEVIDFDCKFYCCK